MTRYCPSQTRFDAIPEQFVPAKSNAIDTIPEQRNQMQLDAGPVHFVPAKSNEIRRYWGAVAGFRSSDAWMPESACVLRPAFEEISFLVRIVLKTCFPKIK